MASEIQRWTVSDVEIMAARVARSRLFNLDESQAFTLMMLAQSEGIHPIKAVQRYHIVQGRPTMKADAMLADFLGAGGTVEWLTESDDRERCEAIFRHPVFAPKGKTVRFTIADAKAAGLSGKDNWRFYAPSMLRARVISTGVRMIAPGIVAGLNAPEDLGATSAPAAVAVEVVEEVARTEPAITHEVAHELSEDEIMDQLAAAEKEKTLDSKPRRKGPRNGPWLEQAARSRGLTDWFLDYGKSRGFPPILGLWSPIMVSEAIAARREAMADPQGERQ